MYCDWRPCPRFIACSPATRAVRVEGTLVVLGEERSKAESTSNVQMLLEAFTAPSYLSGQCRHHGCIRGLPVNTGRRWAVCHGQSAAVGDWLLQLRTEPHMYGVLMCVIFKGMASMLCFEVYLMFSLMVALTKYSANSGVEWTGHSHTKRACNKHKHQLQTST